MAKKRYFAWSPLRTLMNSVGAKIVARDAVDYLMAYLEDKAINLTKKALVFAKHAKRKKITQEDIQLAIRRIERAKRWSSAAVTGLSIIRGSN